MAEKSEIEIRLEHVRKTYPDPADRKKIHTVLNDINLDIRKGEFLSLLGASGCGKSTLLRIIAGLAEPDSGKVTVGGSSCDAARRDHRFGMVFQSPVLYEWRTVRENIALPLEIMKIPKKEREARIEKQLETVSLSGYADSYPHELSGGMQQRVGIARALAAEPDILLMDEPFSALDEFTKQQLHIDLLNIWEATGKTIIFVTHNISEAVFLSDRICIMASGLGEIAALTEIDIPRPRSEADLSTERYFELIRKTRESFEVNWNGNI